MGESDAGSETDNPIFVMGAATRVTDTSYSFVLNPATEHELNGGWIIFTDIRYGWGAAKDARS